MPEPTLAEQIAEVKRELALRERAFPRFVAGGRMRQADADRSMARMKAALHTLLRIEALMELRAAGDHDADVTLSRIGFAPARVVAP